MKSNVDIVYTWVDSNNINWYEQKEYWYNIEKNGDNNKLRFPTTQNSSTEINISICSVLKYVSWIDNIYVVTMRNQIPNIPKNKKIKIIHHEEIWKDPKELPVFNSHAIEANIHRIKNLSENFIYMCDDVFFCNYVNKDDFFINDTIVINGSISPPIFKQNDPYICSHVNLYNLQNMKKYYYNPAHFAVPLKKSIVEQAELFYGELWNNTSKSKFRSIYDIPPIASTISFANKNNILLKMSKLKCAFFKTIKDVKFKGVKSIFNTDCICINNSCPDDEKLWEILYDYIKNNTRNDYLGLKNKIKNKK